MELTGNRMILSFQELRSLVSDYVSNLELHNQTAKLRELLVSLHRQKDSDGHGLEPMLDFMSKHGMPHQFPEDGSHFIDEPEETFRCGPRINSSFEMNLIQRSEYW
jgi:hypothetical protein